MDEPDWYTLTEIQGHYAEELYKMHTTAMAQQCCTEHLRQIVDKAEPGWRQVVEQELGRLRRFQEHIRGCDVREWRALGPAVEGVQ